MRVVFKLRLSDSPELSFPGPNSLTLSLCGRKAKLSLNDPELSKVLSVMTLRHNTLSFAISIPLLR